MALVRRPAPRHGRGLGPRIGQLAAPEAAAGSWASVKPPSLCMYKVPPGLGGLPTPTYLGCLLPGAPDIPPPFVGTSFSWTPPNAA